MYHNTLFLIIFASLFLRVLTTTVFTVVSTRVSTFKGFIPSPSPVAPSAVTITISYSTFKEVFTATTTPNVGPVFKLTAYTTDDCTPNGTWLDIVNYSLPPNTNITGGPFKSYMPTTLLLPKQQVRFFRASMDPTYNPLVGGETGCNYEVGGIPAPSQIDNCVRMSELPFSCMRFVTDED